MIIRKSDFNKILEILAILSLEGNRKWSTLLAFLVSFYFFHGFYFIGEDVRTRKSAPHDLSRIDDKIYFKIRRLAILDLPFRSFPSRRFNSNQLTLKSFLKVILGDMLKMISVKLKFSAFDFYIK